MNHEDSLEDKMDLLELRKAKAEDNPTEPSVSLDEVLKKFGFEDTE